MEKNAVHKEPYHLPINFPSSSILSLTNDHISEQFLCILKIACNKNILPIPEM